MSQNVLSWVLQWDLYTKAIAIQKYPGVNLERTWKVIKEDIFDLKNKILKVRKDIEKNDG